MWSFLIYCAKFFYFCGVFWYFCAYFAYVEPRDTPKSPPRTNAAGEILFRYWVICFGELLSTWNRYVLEVNELDLVAANSLCDNDYGYRLVLIACEVDGGSDDGTALGAADIPIESC